MSSQNFNAARIGLSIQYLHENHARLFFQATLDTNLVLKMEVVIKLVLDDQKISRVLGVQFRSISVILQTLILVLMVGQ